MQKIENGVLVTGNDSFTDIVKEFCNNTNDAKKLLKAIFSEFPELENNPQRQLIECIEEVCYVSDCVNFAADDFTPEDFMDGFVNDDIFKYFVTNIGNNSDYPFETEGGSWCYAIPCDKIKIKIEINK